MSKLRCFTCGTTWDSGELRPMCPNCLAKFWGSSPRMISPKHDPSYLPSASNTYRSVVPNELLEQHEEYFQAIASSGTALWSNKHKGYCYVNGVPPYMTAGSAVPRGSAMPTHALNAFLIADPFGNDRHIYAEDDIKILSYITDGEYEFLPICSVAGCNNRQMPGTILCVKHTNPPKAEEAEDK